MDPNTETSQSAACADDVLSAAHAAASLRPLAIRIAELETVLAVERSEHSRRLKELDSVSRTMRSALQNLQVDARHLRTERDELLAVREERDATVAALQSQLDVLRTRAEAATHVSEIATAEVVASAVARAQSADVELTRSRDVIATLRERVSELESVDGTDGSGVLDRLAKFQEHMTARDAELVRAAEVIRDYERRVGELEAHAQRVELQVSELRSRGTSHAPALRASAPAVQEGRGQFPILAPPRPSRRSDYRTESLTGTVASTQALSSAEPCSDTLDSGGVSDPDNEAPDDTLASLRFSDTGSAAGLLQSSAASESGPGSHAAAPAITPEFPGVDAVLARQESASAAFDQDESSSASVALGHNDGEFPGLRVERERERTAAFTVVDAHKIVGPGAVTVYALRSDCAVPEPEQLEALLRLRHANVISMLSYTAGPGRPHLVAERAGGERADLWVGRVGRVAERIALAVVLQAARGLDIAAEQGLHHGDLSPSDVWVDAAGGVRIAALGLRAALSVPGAPVHVAYAAPEQRAGGDPDVQADVYSLGAILYFLLTGCAAIAVRSERSADSSGVPDPREACADVSDAVAEVVASLTATNPAARPQTWEHTIAALQRGVSGDPARPAGHANGTRRSGIRPHVAVGLLAIPFAIAAAILLVRDAVTTTPRESFDRTVVSAERLVRLGDVDGARALYRKFLHSTGDRDVESDARRRLADLPE